MRTVPRPVDIGQGRYCENQTGPRTQATPVVRILLIGPSGQIGRELQSTLPAVGDVVTAGRTSAVIPLDLTSAASIREAVRSTPADIIVNAAAYTAVDQAESDRDTAFAVNAEAPGVLAECAKSAGSLLVHFSTDYVFDGAAASAYTEDDETNPLSVYGRSKLAGEEAIRANGGRHLILRTSWVYGLHGKNFLLTMLRLASERKTLEVVNDQFGVPNWSRALAVATASAIESLIAEPDRMGERGGTYHLSAIGETTWFGFAQAILDCVRGEPGIVADSVRPITTDDFPTPAPRPARSTLSGARIERALGVTLPDWRVYLQQCLGEWAAGGPA